MNKNNSQSSNDEITYKILNGQVGVIPTDTIYGIVCIASNKSAVARLYDLKNRSSKPGTIIASDIEQLVGLGMKRRYLKAVEKFWPGPVSIVIPFSDIEYSYLHQGKLAIPVRIPADMKLRSLLDKTGPLLTTSANPAGLPPAGNISEVVKYFDKLIDFYEDGGDLSDRLHSTIIRIVDDAVEVLRAGAVNIDKITGEKIE